MKKSVTSLPPFPSEKYPPSTVQGCDEHLRYWSALSERCGVPVIEENGTNSIDRLLEIRANLTKTNNVETTAL